MAIVFPASPSVNDTFTAGSITYKWDGDKWIGLGVTPADRLVEGSNSLEIDANNNLIWSGGGNVGINQNTPTSQSGKVLHISGDTGGQARIHLSTSASGHGVDEGHYIVSQGAESGAVAGQLAFINMENRNITFTTGSAGANATRLTIQHDGNLNIADGNLIVASGHGIDFSANANAAGMTSELLDDYEEGSWTPSIERTSPTGAATYTARSGKYTKIGNVVTIWFDIVWTASPNGSGDYVISGLPFTAVVGQPDEGGFGAPQFRDASGLSSNIRIYGNSSYHAGNYIYTQHYDSSGNTGASPFNASGRVTGWSQYFA